MAGHSHAHRDFDVSVPAAPRVALLTALVAAAAATLVGLWTLWPHADQAPHVPRSAAFAAPGVTFPHARVRQVGEACPSRSTPPNSSCGTITADVQTSVGTGPEVTVQVPPEVSRSGIRVGDTVQLIRTPPADGRPATYTYFTTDRDVSLLWFAVAFAAVVVAVARLRGLLALVALAVSAVMITKFVLPALLAGENGAWVALVGSSAIMFVVLYTTHGPSLRTSTALAGTLVGIAITAAVGLFAIHSSRLTGIPDETGGVLSSFVGNLSFPGLLTCGVIIAGLGVLNDITITQASAVWELRSAAPEMPRRRVFASAMRIGRDHIASTIYTIAFAYAGSSLIVLLLLAIYDRPVLDLVSSEAIAEEIVRTLASGIGLVLAVPITTAIASLVASPSPRGRRRRRTGPLEAR